LADTGHLTTIEHGAYLLLLITMWRAGGTLPNDDKQLARYARMTAGQWARIKPNMMPFFTITSDGITQGRLTDELGIVRQKSEKQSNSAKAKWRKEHNKRHAGAYAEDAIGDIPNECQSDAPISTPTVEEDKSSSVLSETSSNRPGEKPKRTKRKAAYTEAFETFWQSYPRTPNMSKAEAFTEWKKLDEDERAACIAAVPAFKDFLKTKPDLETIHACRFISKRRFEGFAPGQSAINALVSDQQWAKRLRYGRKESKWASDWGPRPGASGCLVPQHLIEPNDGANWTAMEISR
jgi:uncharacterized protein YdaU (DUF1376 family)